MIKIEPPLTSPPSRGRQERGDLEFAKTGRSRRNEEPSQIRCAYIGTENQQGESISLLAFLINELRRLTRTPSVTAAGSPCRRASPRWCKQVSCARPPANALGRDRYTFSIPAMSSSRADNR